jgi:ribosomal-protein-serine acetyltransferase
VGCKYLAMFSFDLGDGVSLRPLEESDVEELYAVIDSDRAYLAEWLPWAAAQTLEGTREFLGTTRRQLAENNGFQAAIVSGGRIIGVVGFHRVDWGNRSATIGYWLASDAQGRGTMTRAVRALVDWAFAGWSLNRVEIQAAVENRRSRAVPQRLGFLEEGTLRQVERVGDRFVDGVIYSVLASEWGTTTALPSKRPARKSARASSARSSG